MRSIHKKTLKRFLSTLLALTMVLGMVPFTASAAAPATVTLEQSGLKATITPSVPAVTAGNTSTVTYAVTIEATAATASGKNVSLTIGPPEHYMSYAFGTVTITGSAITGTVGMPAGLALSGDKITGTVTGGGYAIGSHTVPMSLTVSDLGTDTDSTTFTVDQKADLTLTATPDTVTAGQDFTVSTVSDIAEGYVKFTYEGEDQRVAVIPDENGKGIASATFTATGTAGTQTVTALQYAMTGVVNTEATETITVSAAPVVHTITYMGNAADAYNVPAAETVANGADYNVTTAVPNRTGFTFVGWNTNKDATTATYTGTGSETITNVTSDMTLYAIWAEETVAITWPTGTITGATLDGPTPATAVKGSTVTFKVTVTDGYDGSAMVVTANGSPLYGTKGTGNTYTYTFTATAATTVAVATAPTSIPTYYNVKFVRQAADATAVNWPADFTVEKGTLSVAIPNQIPTRDGYTFVNWAVGAGNVLPGHDITIAAPGVTDDLELRAVWEQDKVDVTYPADVAGVTDVSKNGTETVVKGSLQSFTVTLGTGYDPATLTVTANGVALAPVATGTAGQYQYSFVANATTAIAVSTPSLLQYTVTLPTGENFNALFTAPTPNVTSVTVNYNEGYTFKVAPVGNYTISEVYINGVAQGAGGTYSVASVTGPQTISIVMEAVTFYTVTYVVDGVQLTTRQVQKGSAIPYDVQAPAKDGYTFDGWYTASGFTGTKNSLGNATSDCEVYGRYNPTTATITFNDNGGSGGPVTQTKTYGVALNLSSTAPTWTGHTFLGWGTAADATVAVYQPGDMYSTEGAATLYAVWEDNTYTVTLPNGTGYSVSTTQSTTVKYNTNFTFTVVVDRAYAATAPEVKVNGTALPASTGSISNTSAATWTYTISGITEDKVVSISVTQNATYTVTFKYDMSDDNAAYEGKTFATQQVEHGYMPTQPVAPVIEGYTFSGWTPTDAFTTAVTGATEIKAVYTAITPKVTYPSGDTGWTLTDVVLSGTSTTVASNSTVAYKSSIDFKVTIATGYDATNLAVAANGLALSPVDVTGNVYTFRLANITEDQNITVVGVARKMITITYNDNGGIGGPGQEQVKYYLNPAPTGDPNSTISTVKPTRVGYEFQGWATTNDATAPAYSNPEKTSPATSKTANFTTDTTLYAVWSAKSTSVTLTVDKTSQYEVENVVLTADVTSGGTAVTSGSVQFYRSNNGIAAELIGTAKVSGGKAVLTIATSAYKRGAANTDSYTVKFIPDEGSGYSNADTTADPDVVNVLSAAISWKLDTGTPNPVADKANVLTIKKGSSTETSMTAGQEYTLELPAIYALDATTYSDATKLVVNKDYTVTWQFRNASGTWEDYTAAAGTDSVKILAKYSKYVFRAVVTPLTGATGHFTKAAKYNGAALTADAYEAYLVTEATSPVAQQETATTLSVSDTHDLGSTKAEFEGQKVTLTATVVLKDTTTKVTTGEVYFYRGATLIGKADVQSDGTAVLEATISEYNRAVTDQKDTFKAVYQDNATYKTSESTGVDVLIRSTAIAWAGSKVLTVKDATNANPVGSIIAGTTYTLNLPAVVEDGQSGVSMTVGTDYTVEWYEEAPDGTITKIGATETNTFAVTPATEKVQYYAQVLPKTGSNYTDAYQDGYKNFLTSDKTNESVKAATTTTITFGDVKTDTGKTPDFSQYEEKTITITAQVMNGTKVVPSGTVTFYVVTAEGTNKEIGTAAVDNSGQATVSYTLPAYALSDGLSNIEYFFAMYTDTVGTYADSNTTEVASSAITTPLTHCFGVGTDTKIDKETEAVQILSTSISWQLDTSNTIVASPDANKLKVYTADDNGNKGTEVTDGKMTAGSSYVLELPAVYALDDAQTAATALTVNKDYTVVWQYREFGASDWNDYPIKGVGNTVLITPDYSGYQFQAVVTPVYDNEHLTGYKTAAAYTNDVATGKTASLVTDPTEKTVVQPTTTDLAITGADNEDADVKINGATPFATIGNHKAQFEGQTVTLEATVKETTTGTPAVTTGYVNFYRYVATGNDELLNTTPVAVGANGVATFEVTISNYSTASGQTVLTNVDRFYAVYLINDTYDTSASVTKTGTVYDQPVDADSVYIKSTAIQTPVITSAKAGTGNATSTTYDADLTGLLAGVEHTFTLKTTGATTAESANWSVVAKDGRTVDEANYTIKWYAKHVNDDNKVGDTDAGKSFVTTKTMKDDEFYVELIPQNDMKTGATSKKAIIGTKQDVTVTVTAEDKITSTPEIDVYQLNEIKLTATVTAKESDATVKPSGTVAFYYKDGTNWVYLDEAVLTKDTDGQMRASITTDKLPVTGGTNVKRDVEITAVYLGDETFKVSGNYTESTRTVTAGTGATGNGVTDETVTVYSSVVYVKDTVENKTDPVLKEHTSGIYIYAEEDKVLANETNVNLMLSDVYTLDHDPTLALSKLAYGVDYTVQWQVLVNAAAYSDKTTAPWENITGATNTSCQIDVEDGAAYRAVITVKDTPIAKGSYTFVDQDIDGRQVYYSNILVAADAPATVTVNVNTSNTADGYEGIVEDEKVTIHTYASGASGTTPISELTVTITELDTDGITPVAVVNEQVKTNVNGHVSFDWTAAKPGYYELKVVAKFTNGYDDKTITRTLIVRDNDYGFTAAGDNTTYNGKVQGLTVTVDNMGIENTLAQKSVVVYYYTDANRTQQVEPTQAGTYYATIRLQESAYWTEKTKDTTFTIKQRDVSVVDLIAQAKIYDGTTNANIQEIILNDAETYQDSTGLPKNNTGVINGDSVYAVGTGYTAAATAGATTLGVKDVELKGDDAANYNLADATYTEAFNIQRSQVKGDIANSTFKYTGSNITVPASDIYLIDQAGNEITSANYTVTYYYHNGDGVEKVDAMNKLGKYTVIARPEQANYKGGASETIYVVSDNAVDKDPDTTAKSALIDITNTVELLGAATGIQASATNGATTTVGYWNGTTWGDRPTAAGRYLVKVTASTGDTAYGIYTIVKANPVLTLTAANVTYDSAPYAGAVSGTYNGEAFPAGTYFTYAGGTIQGVAYEAPTEVGTYIVTAHVPETDNYTAHEISAQFVITPKALKITADSLQRRQYGAFPDMTASFDGLATGGVAADTSLRDVQIQPELIFNGTNGYDHIADDHVSNEYPIIAVAALARNYEISYVNGNMSVTREEPNPYLAIHGMIENGDGAENLAYYGDVIQLYAYGSQVGNVINNSSVLTWSVTGPASIDQNGLLTITGVGTVVVKLERGVGAQKISTSITITALKQEVKVVVPELNTVYNAASQDYTTKKTMSAVNAKGEQVFAGNDRFVINGKTRTDVGSQIVTGKVADSIHSFQSETYGGLFTINDKEVTVAPVEQTKVYGTKEAYEAKDSVLTDKAYSETGVVGGKTALTTDGTNKLGVVASVSDLYENIDVSSTGYEILVAGPENMNYNVKYTTAAASATAKVTAKPLTFKTGIIEGSNGRTSGYMENDSLFYKDEGYEVTSTPLKTDPNDRMYGEVNPVMDYAFDALIAGDSEADLANLLAWLVEYSDVIKHNINGDANVEFVDAHLTGHKSTTYLTGMDAYYIDGMLGTAGVKNYTTTVTEATQNIYQRPVTLALKDSQTELDVYIEDAKNDTILMNIIKQNLEVSGYTYGGVEYGGLAEKLGHTMENLQLAITHKTVDLSGDYIVHVKVGNPNYWLSNTCTDSCAASGSCGHSAETFSVKIHVTPDSIKVVYNEPNALGWTSASVVMHKMPEDQPVNLSADSKVYFAIYEDKGEGYDYSGETKIRSGWMNRASQTGVWTCTYSRLTAGNYRIFAIPVGDYTIINSGNVPVPTYPNP